MNKQPQIQKHIFEKNINTVKDKKVKNKYLAIAFVLLAAIVATTFLLLKQYFANVPALNADYPPVPEDSHADKILSSVSNTNKLEHKEGGGAVNLQFQDQLTINISEKKVYLNFANPSCSTQNIILQIIVQDQTVAKSGRLCPGYQLKELELLNGVENLLSEGTYEGKFVINYYDTKTNEKAMISTDAPVTIMVKK